MFMTGAASMRVCVPYLGVQHGSTAPLQTPPSLEHLACLGARNFARLWIARDRSISPVAMPNVAPLPSATLLACDSLDCNDPRGRTGGLADRA